MSLLAHPLPHVECFLRREFLYNLEKGFGEYEPCIWLTLKSVRDQAFTIECYLPNYGACYDKLPLHAFVSRPDNIEHFLPLDFLQIWNCPSFWITSYYKEYLRGSKVQVLMKDKKLYAGHYLFTIDHCMPDGSIVDTTWTHTPDTHKCYNFIQLENGQFAAQPNNRVLFLDPSSNPDPLKRADFHVATRVYEVERNAKWSLGNTDKFDYTDE